MEDEVCSLLKLRHFVDDFVYAAPDMHSAQLSFRKFKAVASLLGVPLKPSKLVGPTPVIEYVGMVFHAPNLTISLPTDKIARLMATLNDWSTSAKPRTKHQAQSLLGHLMHAVQVFPNGKIFCDRLIRFTNASWSNSTVHHKVPKGVRADLLWWLNILPTGLRRRVLSNPSEDSWEEVGFYTDASGELGAGGILGKRRWACRWAEKYTEVNRDGIDIFWKEMFAIMVSLAIWGPTLAGKRVILHCDNMACVWTIRNGRSRHHPRVNHLLRDIVLLKLEFNIELNVLYIASEDNPADAISRLSFPPLQQPDPLPESILRQHRSKLSSKN